MRQGDLAFFYHRFVAAAATPTIGPKHEKLIDSYVWVKYSNCKEPGIVGIMEITKEATPDGKFQGSISTYRMKQMRLI